MITEPVKLPTYREELSFKVMETYCDLLDKHEKGVLNNHELNVAVDALIAATGWGVTFDVFVTLSSANIEKDISFEKRTRIISTSGYLVCVSADPYQYTVEVRAGTVKNRHIETYESVFFSDELNPLEATMAHYKLRTYELKHSEDIESDLNNLRDSAAYP